MQLTEKEGKGQGLRVRGHFPKAMEKSQFFPEDTEREAGRGTSVGENRVRALSGKVSRCSGKEKS